MNFQQKYLGLFYRRLIANHSDKQALLRRFYSFFQQQKRWLQDQYLPKKEAIDVGGNVSEIEGIERMQGRKREQLKEYSEYWNLQLKFISPNINRCLIFAFFRYLILTSNKIHFQLIQSKIYNHIIKNSFFLTSQQEIENILQQIQSLFEVNLYVAQTIIVKLVNNLSQMCCELFLEVFDPKDQIQQEKNNIFGIMTQVSIFLKTQVVYFELQGRKLTNSRRYGLEQRSIYIGQIVEIDRYIVTSNYPAKSQQIPQKQQFLMDIRPKIDNLRQNHTVKQQKINNLYPFQNKIAKESQYIATYVYNKL